MNTEEANQKNIKKLEKLYSLKEKYEKVLNDRKKEDKKALQIKNLEIFKDTLKLLSPIILTTSLTTGAINFLGGGLPFIKDEIVKTKTIKIENDNDTNSLIYNDFYERKRIYISDDQKLIIYTPWKYDKNSNIYERYKRTYDIDKLYNKDLIEILLNKDYEKMEKLNFDYIEEKETSNNIEIDDKNNDYYVEYNINYDNEEDRLTEIEDDKTNTLTTIADLFIGTGLGIRFLKRGLNKYQTNISLHKATYNSSIMPTYTYTEELKKVNEKIKKLENESRRTK